MMTIPYAAGLTILVLCLLLGSGTPLYAGSVEERLVQFNRQQRKESTENLEREARKEGEVVWYAAMASDRAAELIRAFESNYTFLKIRFQPGGASRQLDKLRVA